VRTAIALKDERPVPSAAPTAVTSRIPSQRVTPAPDRVPELGHMDLKRLRAYRRTLLLEAQRVSYWRRVLQARRNVVRIDLAPGDRAMLQAALTEHRGTAERLAMLTLHPDGGMPVLPHLPELWAQDVTGADDTTRAEYYARLSAAESVLSSYREALHKRLDRATADLIARYAENPSLCLAALAEAA
jgi:hypothetical protein